MAGKKIARNSFVEKVEATVRRYALLPRGKTVAVAVSGGPDSVALLEALAALAPQWRCKIAVLHVNHGLRGRESGEDARFVRRLAARYGIAFHGTKLDLGKTSKSSQAVSEEWLREKRYEAIERLARDAGASVVALGHHRDDLAETVLMRFLRGSGPSGLGGFRPRTRRGDLTLVRPLYDCTRDDILKFCKRRGLRWRQDRTNRDTRWLRNRIRHELLPMLEKAYNPRLRDLLADNARWFQEDEAFFEAKARRVLGLSQRKGRSPRSLALATLRTVEPPVLARLFRIWVMAVSGMSLPPTGRQIEELVALVGRPTSRGEVRCAGGVTFFVQSGNLTWRFTASSESPAQGENDDLVACDRIGKTQPPLFRLPAEGVTLLSDLGARHAAPATLLRTEKQQIVSADKRSTFHIEIRRYNRRRQPRSFEKMFRRARSKIQATDLEQYFDADRIEGELVLRNRRPGDRFHPLGTAGSKKLKEFLIDEKAPAPLRPRLILLCDRNRVLWVVGHRICDPVCLTDNTESILCIRIRVSRPH